MFLTPLTFLYSTAPVSDFGHAPGENGLDPALDLSSDSKVRKIHLSFSALALLFFSQDVMEGVTTV